MQGQVTIGSGNPPANGALLDLKENEAPNGDVTSTKGIIFPRVRLVSLTSLMPLLNATDAANATQKTIHKGIVVYNLATNNGLQEDLYFWDGDEWLNLHQTNGYSWATLGNAGTSPATNYIGTSDVTDLSIRTSGQERMRATATGNIGIATVTPASTLTVNGSVAAAYKEVAQSYTLLATDYTVVYSGTVDAIFTMPVVTTTITGRQYVIKNLSASNTLTLSSGAVNFRRGGTVPVNNNMIIPPGFYCMIIANANTSGGVWDVMSLADSHVANTGWTLVATDISTFVNKSQALPAPPTGTPSAADYKDIAGTNLTLTIPANSTQSQVVVRWDIWGDVRVNNASGSLRFGLKYTGPVSRQIESIMMSSWSAPNNNYVRWTAPVVYTFDPNILSPGTYTFSLQVVRESEVGSITSAPILWGSQGRGEVYIK